MPKSKRALVTGCAGFIGSHVVDRLLAEGYEVIGLDNLSTGNPENFSHNLDNEKFSFIKGDIRDVSIFMLMRKVDVVFHLAALARIQPSIEKPVEAHSVNLTGTLNVLEYCRANKAKLVFSSSSSIYEGYDLPTNEMALRDPKNPYALQKWMCEEYIELFGKIYNLDYTILRYFNVFGERQILSGAYSAVVGILLNAKANGKKLPITSDGEQRRDFTYVKDVADANFKAIDWGRRVYNIGTGKNYSINELADLIGGDKEFIGDRIGEARQTLASIHHAEQAGWTPTVDIWDWVRDQI